MAVISLTASDIKNLSNIFLKGSTLIPVSYTHLDVYKRQTFIRPESVPIYSTITAVLCMQPYLSNTKEIAINRIVGTLIGGLAGMLVLMFMRSYIPWPTIQFGIVSLCMIPLIYVTPVSYTHLDVYKRHGSGKGLCQGKTLWV